MLTILLTHISQSIFLNVGQISESMKVKDSERLARFQLRKSAQFRKYVNMCRRIVKSWHDIWPVLETKKGKRSLKIIQFVSSTGEGMK